MPHQLKVSLGQHSAAGRKDDNQDFYGALIPQPPALAMKGITVALADGISSSKVSVIASQAAIKSFLTDYYCTPDSWSVKTSAQRVIAATNSWLYAQNGRGPDTHDRDRGYVCTFSLIVLKSATAHIFHIGDSRIYRVDGRSLEQLTEDHRLVVSSQQSYLSRALGANSHVEIDYRTVPLQPNDIFILATDGVYEYLDPLTITQAIAQAPEDLDGVARRLVELAYERGSPDNLTLQILRVDALPDGETSDFLGNNPHLPPAPLLEPRMMFEGYHILRQIHASSRSHIYLARDNDNGQLVALKVPSIDMRDNADHLKRFMMEEWIARRIDSPHILKAATPIRTRGHLYVVMEHIDGKTLAQWMIDHPQPDLDAVRRIVEQIAAGLLAFHRKEMIHQDLRPANIMIDPSGTVKIIDFGSTRVAGIAEAAGPADQDDILGTAQYTAPEYFLGETGSARSDIFSLGVIAYQMLTGQLPFGTQVAKTRTKAEQRKLRYRPASWENPAIPEWMDAALGKAVHPDPFKRYELLSEFTYDLRHPNPAFSTDRVRPLAERNPILFWKSVSAILLCIVILLLWRLSRG